MGLIASAANAGLEQATGRDIGDRALALLSPSHTAAGTPQYAELASPGAPAGPVAAAAPTAMPSDTGSAGNSLAEAPPGPAGSAQVAAADAKDGADASVAPLSRALAGVAQPPSPAAALGAQPGMLGSTAQAASKGWMLADYRAAAGHGLPVNTANNVSLRSAPIPLQTTVPLVSDMTRTPVVAATAGQPVAAAAASASPESVGSDNWISQAMLRGLDRYREMKKAEDAGPPAQSQRDGTF